MPKYSGVDLPSIHHEESEALIMGQRKEREIERGRGRVEKSQVFSTAAASVDASNTGHKMCKRCR